MKKLLLSSLLVTLCTLVVVFGSPGTAEAAIPGRGTWYGYFNNNLDTGGLDLYPGGITVMDINSFVSFYSTRVSSASEMTNRPAAFTILSMLGAPAGTPYTQARDRFAEWEQAVRWYATNGLVNFNVNYTYSSNTYLQDNVPADVAWYSEGGTLPSIVFYNPNGTTYAIKRDCANPVGEMSRISVPPPPTVVNCGTMDVAPPNPVTTQNITITARVSYSGGPPGGAVVNYSSITVGSNPGAVAHAARISGNQGIITTNPFRVPSAGTYTVTWVIQVNETRRTCSDTFVAYPPTLADCGSVSLNTSQPEVGQPLVLTTRVNFSGGPPNPVASDGTIRVRGPAYSQDWAVNSPPTNPRIVGQTIYLTSPSFSVSRTGTYTVAWSVRINEITVSCNGSFDPSGGSFEVRDYPYLEINGGDVAAGAGFVTSSGGSCGTSNDNAGVVSWNSNRSPYRGAGGEYGVFAMNFIQEFLTGQGSGRAQNILAFANENPNGGPQTVDLPQGLYGGFFGQGPCANQWEDKPNTGGNIPNPNNVNVNNLPNDVYVHNGNIILNASDLQPGKKITMYVEGDVSIRGNITYGTNTTWANIAEIPVLKLIAQGVIYIEDSVTRLDGVYSAIPANNSYATDDNSYGNPDAGTISTCSNGFAVRNPTAAPVNPYLNLCNRSLEINGSLIANHIFFLRKSGSMSSGTAAETINFSPEVWLAPSTTGSLDPTYQSIVGLPPVL